MNTQKYFYLQHSITKATFYILILFSCIFFIGCKKSNNHSKLQSIESMPNKFDDKKMPQSLTNENETEDFSNLTHEDLNIYASIDVPLPIKTNSVMILNNNKTNSTLNYYESYLDKESIINFYNQSLEFEGWQVDDISNNIEGLITCRKPNRCCVISIRPNTKLELPSSYKNSISIFIKKFNDNLLVTGK